MTEENKTNTEPELQDELSKMAEVPSKLIAKGLKFVRELIEDKASLKDSEKDK